VHVQLGPVPLREPSERQVVAPGGGSNDGVDVGLLHVLPPITQVRRQGLHH